MADHPDLALRPGDGPLRVLAALKRRVLVAWPLVAALMVSVSFGFVGVAPNPGCSPDVVPLGQVHPSDEGMPLAPIWCFSLTPGTATFSSSGNTWEDVFNNSVVLERLDDTDLGYRVFNNITLHAVPQQTQHFAQAGSWFSDVYATQANVGATLRPNRSFTFANGTLVVEADVAPRMDDYLTGSGSIFPEIDISQAPAPTGHVVDSLYGYGQFGGFWTVGCRLHTGSNAPTICAVESAAGNVPNNQASCNKEMPSRIMEISDFEVCGTTHSGGNHFSSDGYYRECAPNTSYDNCLDRIRIELTQTGLTLFVNGHQYFQDTGWDTAHQLPDSMVNGGQVYVYFTDWVGGQPNNVYRFNWSRLAVNPPGGLSVSPTFCLGAPNNTCGATAATSTPTATPSATLTPSPTATRVATSTPTPTLTATPLARCRVHPNAKHCR